jgi:hypothetical protein
MTKSNKMNRSLILLILFLSVNKTNGQSPLSCQENNWHRVMEKQLLKSNFNYPDSLCIILYDSLPPINWWISTKTRPWQIYNKQKLVEIINTSKVPIFFMKPDRQLMLGLQAKNQKGEWEDVEEFFQGVCGNSFKKSYNDSLKNNEKWLSFVELPTGAVKTQYRLKLQLITRNFPNHRFYYSNEINGNIDLCRFIKKH